MSFLVDPPMLVGAGAAIESLLPDDRSRRIAEAAVVATFVSFSVGLYFERAETTWLSRMVGARSGRDWMINSRVTDFEYESPPTSTHIASAAIFATYPLWARAGRHLARALTPTP